MAIGIFVFTVLAIFRSVFRFCTKKAWFFGFGVFCGLSFILFCSRSPVFDKDQCLPLPSILFWVHDLITVETLNDRTMLYLFFFLVKFLFVLLVASNCRNGWNKELYLLRFLTDLFIEISFANCLNGIPETLTFKMVWAAYLRAPYNYIWERLWLLQLKMT